MSNFLRIHQRSVDWSPAVVGTDETTAVFSVKAGTRVIAASAEPLTNAAGSTTSTASLGDGTSVSGFITSGSGSGNLDLELSTAGVKVQGTGALLLASLGKLYTVDDTVDVTYTANTAGATNPKVRFCIYTLRER